MEKKIDSKHDMIVKIMGYQSLTEPQKQLLGKAYDIADQCHQGQLRENGAPYLEHPMNVAYIVAQNYGDVDTMIAALLHDTLEDSTISLEQIASTFGDSVAQLVDGVTKLDKKEFFGSAEQKIASNMKKLFLSGLADARIWLLKLADRLHNMRTLNFKKDLKKQVETAQETKCIFIPFAYYLGYEDIRNELENLCFQYLEPSHYAYIKQAVDQLYQLLQSDFHRLKDELEQMLHNSQISFEPLEFRIKNLYDIYNQVVQCTNMPLEQAIQKSYNLFAFRIIVSNLAECYKMVQLVHNTFICNPHWEHNYLEIPNDNLYQAYHTTIEGETKLGYPWSDIYSLQLQIQTSKMSIRNRKGLYQQFPNPGLFTHFMNSQTSLFHQISQLSPDLNPLDYYQSVSQIIAGNSLRGKVLQFPDIYNRKSV